MTPATIERKARTPIAILIPGARSAMWCSEPGEADVRVLLLAGRRVLVLAVVEVALLELLGLRARVAQDHAEADPEGVEGGQERGRVAADGEDPVHPAALGREDHDLVLREEPGHQREAGERERADDQGEAR